MGGGIRYRPNPASTLLVDNALVLINELALRRARFAPGWVTVLGRVDHLGAEPAIEVYSVWPSLCG